MITKQVLIALILIIMFCGNQVIFSQSSSEEKKNSLEQGSWSLQFQISSNFTLRSFQGTNFSVKRHLSSKSAIRFGIGLLAVTNDREEESDENNSFNLARKTEIEDNQTQINISSYYIYYPNPHKNINVYFGGGPILGYSDYDETRNGTDVIQDTINVQNRYKNEVKGYSIGILGLIGVEWFVNKDISFHAEYGSSFFYEKSKLETTSTRISTSNNDDTKVVTTEDKRFMFRSNGVKFGISVYF